MGRAIKVNRESVARAARMYRSNEDAARALDISGATFTDYCKKFGIETPSARRRRLKARDRGRTPSEDTD